jgi:multidrug efflux system outer membrane protein
MARQLRFLLACGAVALAGCTMGPDYKRPEVAMASAWRTTAAEAADLANSDWWHAFGDPKLDALIEAALEANNDLKLAAFRIDEFDARLQVSRSGIYPQVGYSANASRELRSQERPNDVRPGSSPTVSIFNIGGTLSWELDLWGRVKRSNEAALADLLSTQEARRGVMLRVVADVATGYVRLLELDRRLELARQKLQTRRESLHLVDQRFQGGSGTRLAVEEARALAESQAAELPAIEREILSVEYALSGLLGRNPGPIERRELGSLNLPQLPQGVPADVLARRPDIAEAEQQLIAANARIGVAKTGYFPTLSLSAALGLGADDLRWLWAETARTGSVGASIAGPILNGGRVEGDVRQAEAIRSQMEVRFVQAVQTALSEVEDALGARAKAGERESALGRQVAALQDLTRLARARQEGGQWGRIEVLEMDLKLYNAQATQAETRRDTLLSLVAVYKAMGGGWMVEQEKRRSAPPVAAVQAQATTREEARK